MKKLILLLPLFISFCNLPDIQCRPDLPCDKKDLQYVHVTYDPPPADPTPPPYVPIMPDKPIIYVKTGDGQVTITWSDCPNATSYNVYKNGVMVGSGTSPYAMSGLTNDTMYTFEVSSVNADGEIMSDPVDAMPGIIDNLDGTITVVNMGLTWSKCSQSDATGGDTYNIAFNDCSVGVPKKLIFCDTRWYCTDPAGVALNGSGVSEIYNTCSAKGMRVPTADEMLALNYYYSYKYWPDIVNDNYYPNNGWSSPQPYGGYVWINIIQGTFSSANFSDFTLPATKGYALCVN